MNGRGLARILMGYALTLFFACLALHRYTSLRAIEPAERRTIASRWVNGRRVARTIMQPGEGSACTSPDPEGTWVCETVIAEGPLSFDAARFALALVPARDGVMAELGGVRAFATPDDLVAAQAYDSATSLLDPSLGIGTHRAVVLQLLATDLGVSVASVEREARVKRVRFHSATGPEAPLPTKVTGRDLTPAVVRQAMHAAASHLARGVDATGRFRYLVDATTNRDRVSYNWPRHAGTTYFLAQAAALTDDSALRFACLRAASLLRAERMKPCGSNACIADGDDADVGSSALALIAFSEIVRTGADASYRPAIIELAQFLRSQQRADGELMHLFNRTSGTRADVQFLYSTGEAALGLARAHRITGDAKDLDAATRALSYAVGPGWSFFGSRYYMSEEHWTCQAMSELWDRAPNREALAFCLRWHEIQRTLQFAEGESAFDADGSFSFGPLLTPRVTPTSSRGEAAAAALDVMMRDPNAGTLSARARAEAILSLEDELDRALAFVVRRQIRHESRHLFAAPEDALGALPASVVDMQLRIDYAQHAGSMMARWLELPLRAH